MKLKMVVISVVVSASLVAGIGYGAYYAMKGQAVPVEVVPVKNVNFNYGFWGEDNSMYGSVTSQIAQIITLNEEYEISEIFVKEGDRVREGTPLFSYDMTLPELELEMAKLDLQTNELTKVKLEKDLEKLKNTRAIASLEPDGGVRTMSSDEEELLIPEETQEMESAAETESEKQQDGTEPETEKETETEAKARQKGVALEQIEELESSPELDDEEGAGEKNGSQEDGKTLQEADRASGFEHLVEAIHILFRTYGDTIVSEDVEDAVEEAVSYYRKNLADETVTQETQPDGTVCDVVRYELKPEVAEALGEEGAQVLRDYAKRMDQCQQWYVELKIAELDPENPGDFVQAVAAARSAFQALTTEQQKEVRNVERLEKLESIAEEQKMAQNAESESQTSTEGTEPESQMVTEGTEPESQMATEGTEPESQTSTEGAEPESQMVTEGAEPESQTSTEGTEPENQTSTEGTELESQTSTEGLSVIENDTPAGESELPEETQITETQGAEMDSLLVFDESESAPEPESGEEPESATESEQPIRYGVTVKNGILEGSGATTEAFAAGETVTVTAMPQDARQQFIGWEFTPQEVQPADAAAGTTTFVMPACEVVATAVFEDELRSRINTFIALAETALGADGTVPEEYDPEALETAILFYKVNLADETDDIVDGNAATLEEYVLKQAVSDYLTQQEEAHQILYLPNRYRQLCMTWVKVLVDNLDPYQLTRPAYEAARNAYESLGENWKAELDASVYGQEGADGQTEAAPENVLSENGQTIPAFTEAPETGGESFENGYEEGTEGEAPETEAETETEAPGILTYGEKLDALRVILLIQEIDTEQQEELLIVNLLQARDAYQALNGSQRAMVWNDDVLTSLLQRYGLLEEETETEETEFNWNDGFDDFDGSEGYTAEELKELIAEKENEIRECDLDIRSGEIAVRRQQRLVDKKTVKSSMEGTVISIGSKDGNSENDYFAKVANEAGLYAKGSMSELALESIQIGDVISGTTDDGMPFSAVIKEISEYPDPEGANNQMGWGMTNSNVSYYPFYALIEDAEGIAEGGATLSLSAPSNVSLEDIYLESYFIREEKDGSTYVYKQDDTGKLAKQYVTTGKESYGSIQILSGLTEEDLIAFPYGKNVVEGAPTKEVDQLQDAFQ